MVVASILSLALAADTTAPPTSEPSTEQPAQPASASPSSVPAPNPDPAAAPPPSATPAPAPPTEASIADGVPATTEGAAPPSSPLAALSDEELERLYLKAYAAWQQGHWVLAAQKAEEILQVAPNYRPALLLRAYAHTKRSDPTAGIAELRAIAELPVNNDFERSIQQRAILLATRYTDRLRRDQISISLGQGLVLERWLNGFSLSSSGVIQLQVPVWDVLAVRADYSGALDLGNTLAVTGPHIAVMGVASFPMKDARSYLDVGIGPAIWVAEGVYWPQNVHVYPGMRTAVGYDWRWTRRTGVRVESGWTWWPGLEKDLKVLTEPLDARVALTVWFGK